MDRELVSSLRIPGTVPGSVQREITIWEEPDGWFTLVDVNKVSTLTTVTTEQRTLMLDEALSQMSEIAKMASPDASRIVRAQPDNIRHACANL